MASKPQAVEQLYIWKKQLYVASDGELYKVPLQGGVLEAAQVTDEEALDFAKATKSGRVPLRQAGTKDAEPAPSVKPTNTKAKKQ